jgi:hypothetical protein
LYNFHIANQQQICIEKSTEGMDELKLNNKWANDQSQ